MPANSKMPRIFQSTHPARGATSGVMTLKESGKISIHAPREGCDPVFANIGEQPILFQSTHPARGAT